MQPPGRPDTEAPSSAQTSLFRAAALERLSGHDNLGQTIELVRSIDWFIFLFGGGLIAALVLWLYLGTITTTIQVEGVVQQAKAEGASGAAVLFVPARQGNNIKEGMPVALSRGLLYSSNDGSFTGTVESVSKAPLSMDDADPLIDAEVVKYLFRNGPCFRVVVNIGGAPAPRGAAFERLHGEVIVEQYKPIKMIASLIGGTEE